MGIFVARRNTLLLGYDVSRKDFITGRDRNGSSIHTEKLHDCILELIEQAMEDKPDFLQHLLYAIRQISEECVLRQVDEVQAIFDSKSVCKKLAACFREKVGTHIFPCEESEEKRFDRTFKNREKLVLPSTLVAILRKGGYRGIEAEICHLFSDKNTIALGIESQALVESSLFRLNAVDDIFKIRREMLFIIFRS